MIHTINHVPYHIILPQPTPPFPPKSPFYMKTNFLPFSQVYKAANRAKPNATAPPKEPATKWDPAPAGTVLALADGVREAVVERTMLLVLDRVPVMVEFVTFGFGDGEPVGAAIEVVPSKVSVTVVMVTVSLAVLLEVIAVVLLVSAGAALVEDSSERFAHAASAAARTSRALSAQAVKTQVVASVWIASLLAGTHWHAKSVISQVVALATEAATQGWAHTGRVL